MDFDRIILKSLLSNKLYFEKIFPLLKDIHFTTDNRKKFFKLIKSFYKEYNETPAIQQISLHQKNSNIIDEDNFKRILQEIVKNKLTYSDDVLLNETEKYVKKVSLSNAILESVDIIENDMDFGSVLGKIETALSIKIDNNLGMNWKDSILDRFEYYQKIMSGLKSNINSLDQTLDGGFKGKTLNLINGASHSGKSAFMIYLSASFMYQKKNVIYFTLEMSENEIGKRIDGNVLDIATNDIKTLSKVEYNRKLKEVSKNVGDLIIKEYPAGLLTATMMKNVIDEYKRLGVVFDAIVVDYLQLMGSDRVSMGKVGTNDYFKAVAEELRALAITYDVPIITGAQLNRSAFNKTDGGMEKIAESIAIVQTADFAVNLLSTEASRETNSLLLKIVKNRYSGQLPGIWINADFSRSLFFDEGEENIFKTTKKINNKVEKDTGLNLV